MPRRRESACRRRSGSGWENSCARSSVANTVALRLRDGEWRAEGQPPFAARHSLFSYPQMGEMAIRPAATRHLLARQALREVVGLDQLDRRLDPAGEGLASKLLQAVVDAHLRHVGAVLLDSCKHLAALDQ